MGECRAHEEDWISVEPAIGDEHFNEVATGNGPAGSKLTSSRPGTPFTAQSAARSPMAPQPQFAPPGSEPPPRTARRARSRNGPAPAAGSSWKELYTAGKRHLLELRDYARLLQGVKADRAAMQVRRKVTQAVLVAAGALVVVALLIGSTMRVIAGLARGLSVLFDGRVWLADLVTGAALIAVVFGAAALAIWRKNRQELQDHIRKYERLNEERNAHRAVNGTQQVPRPR
jgi:hypothetical protein